jgi:hypothetical protein
MGVTGVGKSTFINLFSDNKTIVGHGLEACKQNDGRFRSQLSLIPLIQALPQWIFIRPHFPMEPSCS